MARKVSKVAREQAEELNHGLEEVAGVCSYLCQSLPKSGEFVIVPAKQTTLMVTMKNGEIVEVTRMLLDGDYVGVMTLTLEVKPVTKKLRDQRLK